MSVYRAAPLTPPMVLSTARALVGLDPASGLEVWEQALPAPATLLFVHEGRLLAVVKNGLLSFDRATGERLSTVKLPFSPSFGAVEGSCVYLAQSEGMVCIGATGTVLWKIAREVVGATSVGRAGEESTICRDAHGEELWRSPVQFFARPMVLGNQVIQPDDRE